MSSHEPEQDPPGMNIGVLQLPQLIKEKVLSLPTNLSLSGTCGKLFTAYTELLQIA